MDIERAGPREASGLPSVARAAAFLARQAEIALGESDLSLPQYRVLSILAEGMALPSSMADNLDVRRPSITAVVDGLVAKGLVVRNHDDDDRRKVTHSITRSGSRTLAAADRAIEQRLFQVASTLGDADLVTAAMEGLGRWSAALVEWRKLRARQAVNQ